MTKDKIKLNNRYTCKVSNKLVTVQVIKIDSDRNKYKCLNLQTNRVIVLRSGARLRPLV